VTADESVQFAVFRPPRKDRFLDCCDAHPMSEKGPACVKTLRGITAPGILRLVVTLRAKKRKNSCSARCYDQIRFRFHTAWVSCRRQTMSALATAFAESGHGILPGMGTRPRSPPGDPMTLGNMAPMACGRSTCRAGSAANGRSWARNRGPITCRCHRLARPASTDFARCRPSRTCLRYSTAPIRIAHQFLGLQLGVGW
jgi:hypothetical protein